MIAIQMTSHASLAQAGSYGEIDGVIRDSSQAVVPGATVQIVNLTTGAVRNVKTSNLGYYTVPLLPPGRYKITVSMQGFARQARPDVPLQVQQRLAVDFVIAPATQTNQVTVKAQAVILSTNAHTGEVINQQQVVGLPLNGRQFSELILLAPGASPQSGAMQTSFLVQQGAGGVSPSVNGQSGRFNNYALDGINNEEEFTQRWAISPPPDAIQEFRSSDDQTYAGTSINVVTKSGRMSSTVTFGNSYGMTRWMLAILLTRTGFLIDKISMGLQPEALCTCPKLWMAAKRSPGSSDTGKGSGQTRD